MNVWFFVILIIAVAIVLGPISMLKPSPAQKRKEALRLMASERGVRFSMRRLPALKTDMDQPAVFPVYSLPPQPAMQAAADWMLVRTRYEHEGNFFREWDWQTDVRPTQRVCDLLLEFLPKLPASVPAIVQGRSGTCVFWSELEDQDTLGLLLELLVKLDKALAVESS